MYSLMDIWDISTFWLIWITLLWTPWTVFCINTCFHFSWVSGRSRLLDYVVTLCLTLWGTIRLFFHSGCAQQCADTPFVPLRHLHLLSVFPLMMAILTGVRWYLITAFTCISWLGVLSIFSWQYVLPWASYSSSPPWLHSHHIVQHHCRHSS